MTHIGQLQVELQRSKQELETAYEELQSTNEELETTNEELQSTVEELETTNEELQSTNEELETANEELQSTNEELQTVNIELRDRTDKLLKSNEFQKAILASLRTGVAVLDQRLNVRSGIRRRKRVGIEGGRSQGTVVCRSRYRTSRRSARCASSPCRVLGSRRV